MLIPSTYDKISLKSKRCKKCNNPVLQTTADLGRSSAFKFSNFLIQYMPKIYFLAARTHSPTSGDAFLEVINTTDNEMVVTLESYSPATMGYKETATLLPLEGGISLGIKESARDELQVVDDPEALQQLPKGEKSILLKCTKNFAIVQMGFSVKEGAKVVLVWLE